MGKTWVIKAGGELLAAPGARKKIVGDLAALVRSRPVVLVHGGGPQIEAELTRRRIGIRYAAGRRVTSPETMDVVEKVLSGTLNKGLAAELLLGGVRAVGLSCRDGGLIEGKPIPSLGRAAAPVRVRPGLIKVLLKGRFLPVLAPVASDRAGKAVNVNADDAASALAVALKAENLVFLTDVDGVRDSRKVRIPVLHLRDIDELIKTGVVRGGMIPKLQSARDAIRKGVKQITIINGFHGVKWAGGTQIKR